MNTLSAAGALALALALGAAPAAQAQSAPAGAEKRAAAKPSSVPKKSARPAKAAEPEPPPADEPQQTAAQQALLGDYQCEFGQVVKLEPDAKHAYYVSLTHGKQSWLMKPVMSSTGALRLEDVRGRMLMIQIANKSMVMDTKVGQRVVDGCQHEKQREFARTMTGGADNAGALLKN